MNSLTKQIKATTGLSMGDFCAKELKTDYKAFFWRMKNGSLYPAEIFYIVWRTRKSVQELFGKSWHEILIDNSNAPVVEDVRAIIANMTEAEKEEFESLLGFNKYRGSVQERHKPIERIEDARERPKTPEEAAPSPTPPEPEPGATENPLKKLFKNTY